MSLEHFDDFVVVDGPVQDEVVLFGGDQNRVFVVGVGQLLDFVVFHEEFFEDLSSAGVVHIEGGAVSDVEQAAIVREVDSHDFFHVLLDDLGGFETAHDGIIEFDGFGHFNRLGTHLIMIELNVIIELSLRINLIIIQCD